MIHDLLRGNARFAETVFEQEREHFAELAKAQKPTVLWIGCSDSRVPVNTITQTRAGEVFVHRNVANIVAPNDWNLSAVLEFSINHLNIPDIVICGHYGCGGILALDQGCEHDQYVPMWPGLVDVSPTVALVPVCCQDQARRRGLGGPQARRRNAVMGTNRRESGGLRP